MGIHITAPGGTGGGGPETDAAALAALGAHEIDTTAVHGIADTSALETAAGAAAKVSAHEADTTAVHGIASTADLVQRTLVDAKGDLLVATADNALARRGVGSNGQVLTADSADTTGVRWAAPAGGGGAPNTDEFDGTSLGVVSAPQGVPTIDFSSVWGIASGIPYLDLVGAVDGEAALLVADPLTGSLALIQPTGTVPG